MRKRIITFSLSLIITIILGILMICTCIPRSWGFQSIRNFFDLVSSASGSLTVSSIAWTGISPYFAISLFFCYLSFQKLRGHEYFFLSDSITTKRKILTGIVWFVIAVVIVTIYTYLNYYTWFY
jgi:heme/copper-type cytochrome/quinol oxidase subunit 4